MEPWKSELSEPEKIAFSCRPS